MADPKKTRNSQTLKMLRDKVSFFSSNPQKSIGQATGETKGSNGGYEVEDFKPSNPFAGPAHIAQSKDGGKTWTNTPDGVQDPKDYINK